MRKYIEATKLTEWIQKESVFSHEIKQNQAEGNKCGHWEYWEGWAGNAYRRIDDATCSLCGYWFPHTFVATETENHTPNLLPNYCPNCGAKMKEE